MFKGFRVERKEGKRRRVWIEGRIEKGWRNRMHREMELRRMEEETVDWMRIKKGERVDRRAEEPLGNLGGVKVGREESRQCYDVFFLQYP